MINTIKMLAAIFLMLLIFDTISAQQNKPKAAGLIYPEIIIVDDFEINNPVYKNYPYKELKLFIEPGVHANKSIKLEKAKNEHSDYLKTCIVDAEGNEAFVNNRLNGLLWTKFKSYNLLYYETKGDFVKVKVNGSFYWLSKSQIENFGFSAQNWKEYFQHTNNNNLIVTVNLNLRKQAGVESKKIWTINGNVRHKLETTGNFKGLWAEVDVSIYKDNWEVNNPLQIYKQITGWVKFLDESGKPNIRSAPLGC